MVSYSHTFDWHILHPITISRMVVPLAKFRIQEAQLTLEDIQPALMHIHVQTQNKCSLLCGGLRELASKKEAKVKIEEMKIT